MSESPSTAPTGARVAARIVLLVWASFWTFYYVASGIGELLELGPPATIGHFAVALAMIAVVGVVWRRERVGALLLVALGLAVQLVLSPPPLTALALTVPPVATGALLILPIAQRRTPVRG
jgi:predicted branched-subunit amino acid permease